VCGRKATILSFFPASCEKFPHSMQRQWNVEEKKRYDLKKSFLKKKILFDPGIGHS
jgi:hypothetical protein